MTRMLSVIVVITTVLCAGPGYSGQRPVAVTHKLVGQSNQASPGDLEYSLHVVNIGSGKLSNIRLSLVAPAHMTRVTEIEVGALAPGQGTDVRFRLGTSGKPDRYGSPGMSMWWDGKAVDAAGATIEFPVKSRAEVSHE